MYAAKLDLINGKVARTCQGCGLFASCEEILYLDGKRMWLCGNCVDFLKRNLKMLLANDIDHIKLRRYLKWWRANHSKLKAGGKIIKKRR